MDTCERALRLPWQKDWVDLAARLELEAPARAPASSGADRALAALVEKGALLPMDAFGGSSKAGKWKTPPKRGESDLLAAYCVSPPFRSVVNRVASSFGRIPFFVEDGDRRDVEHPAIRLLNRYNARMLGSQGRELEQVYLDTTGDAVTIIAPKAGETKMELFPVPSTWVTIDTVAGRPVYIVDMGGQKFQFGAESVLHQREIDPSNPYGRGMGTGWAAGDEIQADEYVAKHVGAYFYNSTRPEFIGILKGANETQLEKWQADWDSAHRGFRRAWRPAWLNFEVDFKELTSRLGEEKVRELRDSHLEMIQWLYGVPPEVLGRVTNSNRATIKEAKEMMGTYVLDPRAARRRDVWQEVVDVAFDGAPVGYVSPIPRELDREDEILTRQAHHFTRNEHRRRAGYDDVPDGDVYLVPANLVEAKAKRTIQQAGRRSVVLELVEGGK